MENRTDKNSYTILFAIAMVFVVGTLLAFTASYLSDRIAENERMERQQNILYAMGINGNEGTGDITFISTDKVAEAFTTNIKEQLVLEHKDGSIVKQMTRQQYVDTYGKEPYLIDVKKQQASAKKGNSRMLPLFVGEDKGEKFYIA